MSDKVWLVTQGEYSDYRVLFACSDEDRADAYVKEWHKLAEKAGEDFLALEDPPRVEEVPLDPTASPGYVHFAAHGRDDAGMDGIHVNAFIKREPADKRAVATTREFQGAIIVSAVSSDRSAALKSVKDRLAAIISRQ